jgi:hypothetical protein
MPQDHNGKELQVGDKVMVPATVIDVHPGQEYYNIRVELDHIGPGYDEKSLQDLNSRQVEKQGDPN